MKPAVLAPDAQAEVAAAAAWYEGRFAGLGERFVSSIDDMVARISELPEAFPVWDGNPRFRKAVVPRFPYVVFYVERVDVIEITAVAHTARLPGYWRPRE